MLAIVKRGEQELHDWIQDEVGFITGACQYDNRPINLEPYQVAFLQDRNQFRWVTKARQVGFSFLLALEALARCHLKNNHTSVFVSYALDEAKERVALARAVHETLPLGYQKKLSTDTKTELSFVSNSSSRSVSRIVSVPSKAPRGKAGCVVLDELAHYGNDHEVYRGATALISRGRGQLTGCSSPLGKRGIFWEIAEQEHKYPRFTRRTVPWWYCRGFCRDPLSAARASKQELLTPAEMVERFGLREIVDQFQSLLIEDFRQEFCAEFVDETSSFYPYELILPCTDDDVQLAQDYSSVPAPTGRLVAGFDVGRTRDASELAVFEELDGKFTCRMLRTFEDTPFAQQEGALRRMLDTLPIARLSIDSSGIGMNIAENLTRDYPEMVVAEAFTNQAKERWANSFKLLLQKRQVVLPRDRSLTSQIHGIKKRDLPSGKSSFEAERTTRHGHADKFWAVALACQQEPDWRRADVPEVRVRIIGTREENLAEARREAGLEPNKRHWLLPPEDYDGDKQTWKPVGAVTLTPCDLFSRR